MSFIKRKPPEMKFSLRALAHLLSYPDADLRKHLPELREAFKTEAALGTARLAELDALLAQLGRRRGLDVEEQYVELFDRGRGTSLHLFEHVHGDSRDRGPAMVDLVKTYEEAGLYLEPGELPDYLPVVLQYASTQPAEAAVSFLSEIAHIVRAVFSALVKRESPYATVLAALLDLAGERAEPVAIRDDEDLDASWQEPVAFDGCSTQGQSRPGAADPTKTSQGQVHPIHVVRRPTSDSHASAQSGVRS